MGACCGSSNESDPENQVVNKELRAAQRIAKSVEKLLLLGAGGSGKSTFFKQLNCIHGNGHSKRDREAYKRQIYSQIIEAMQNLIRHSRLIQQSIDEPDSPIGETFARINPKDYIIEEEIEESADFVEELGRNYAEMDSELADHMKRLWEESETIQKLFHFATKIAVPESTKYFLDELFRIRAIDYSPSDKDILNIRYRTTGMTEKLFTIEERTMKIVDVGGQRNERKKWMSFFDDVIAVIFVVSLTSYDEIPFEDAMDLDTDVRKTNNMIESLTVFKETINNHMFTDTAFILFLNKSDLFEEKIKTVNITTAFPDYSGEQAFDDAADYIQERFQDLNISDTREIYSHVTCAMDQDNVTKLFSDVSHTIMNVSLAKANLI